MEIVLNGKLLAGQDNSTEMDSADSMPVARVSSMKATPPGYVFVIAPARSGTTALSHMLAGQLDLQCSPETNVMGILQRIGKSNPDMTFEAFQRAQAAFLMHGSKRTYSIVFPRNLWSQRILDLPRRFAELILRADSYTEGLHVLEQTPRNGEHALLLRWLFPEAIIVYLLRNPFDVVQSNRATPWGASNPLALFALWSRQQVEVARMVRFYGRSRLAILRYEKLSSPAYRDAIVRRLSRMGIERRAAPIEVVPRNFAGTEWATSHFQQTVGEFRPRRESKWTSRYKWVARVGSSICLSCLTAFRSPRCRKHVGWWRVVGLASFFASSVLGR